MAGRDGCDKRGLADELGLALTLKPSFDGVGGAWGCGWAPENDDERWAP